MALLFSINSDNPQPRLIRQAAEMLRNGAVICCPTDTGYGISCDIFNQKAVKRIFQIKKRPKHKPFSFMCSSLKNVADYGYVSNTAYRLMKKNLPGPYTFVLPGSKLVPKIMTTKQKTVGIRVPDNRVCLALLEELGNPILNTSVSIGEDDVAPATEAYEFETQLGNLVDLIIDSGPIYPNPSTVVSFVGDAPEILREGKGDSSQFF